MDVGLIALFHITKQDIDKNDMDDWMRVCNAEMRNCREFI
jgi:hypothetical protein